MSDKSILITGCSTGIGRHCALALKERGWRVFATARTDEDIAGLEAEGLEALKLDYCEPDSISACAREVELRTDRQLFALFNNGAYGQPGAVEDLPVEALREQLEANVLGWHQLTTAILPMMRETGRGRIVQNSSVLGLVAMKYRGAYCASKFAIEGLTSALRLELEGTDIHAVLIEPGPIESKFAINAARKFEQYIDWENSPHAPAYARHKKLLERGGTSSRVKLGPEAVCDKLIAALESPRPKAHYYVTVPTHLLAALRRLLPVSVLDRALLFASDRG